MADFLGSNDDDFDFDKAASAFPDIDLDDPSSFAPAGPSAPSFSLDEFDAPHVGTEVKVTGDDEIERFEEAFPDLGPSVDARPISAVPTFGATPTFAPRPQPSAFASTPILAGPLPTEPEEEPEAIRQWRDKQAIAIQERDEASKAKRQETIARAERSIDQFYEDYNAKKERTIRENKQDEAEYLTTLTSSLGEGTTWSRICALIELENSQSKTLSRAGAGTSDLGRFREVLLRLRREGESAPGAAGY